MKYLNDIRELRDRAALQRRKGDALDKRARDDDAAIAFQIALEFLNQALSLIQEHGGDVFLAPKNDERVDTLLVNESIEVLGSRGGVLRRLDRTSEALESYRDGADVERNHGVHSTYNRTNALKLAILSHDRTLAELKPELLELRNVLSGVLDNDVEAAEKAWNWADLGDCNALLGDWEAASTAYITFINKAETHSPETTLSMLMQLESALCEVNDPGADSVTQSIVSIRNRLASR